MDPRIEEAQEMISSMKNKCQIKREEKLARSNNKNNNNNGNFESNYSASEATGRDHRSSSGRLSSGLGSASNESAFSSGSSESDESDEQHLPASSSSSSGRSSANRSDSPGDLSESRQLNTVCNLAPATREARALVEEIRARFLEGLTRGASDDNYEQLDLIELRKELPENLQEQEQALAFRWISRFIDFQKLLKLHREQHQEEKKSQQHKSKEEAKLALDKALDEATEKLQEFLEFRKHYQLTHVLVDQFCKEIYLLHGIFPFGYDKNHLPIMYIRARVHRRWSHDLDEAFRRYVAWQVNLMTKSYSGAKVSKSVGRNGIEKDGSFGICFDCLNVGYSCVDMDFLNYLVKILVNYYPTYCRYALCVDLPWLFRSVWKLVRSWLPDEARNTVHLITAKQLKEFIDEEQLPNSIMVNDLPASEKPESGKHEIPENFESVRDFQQLAKELKLNSSEVKQFKAHAEKVLKEYKQLGAM